MTAVVEDQDTFTIEVTDVDARGAVRCQTGFMLKVPKTKIVLIKRLRTCKNPATKRVRVVCGNGHEAVKFICDPCLAKLRGGWFVCRICLNDVTYVGNM